YPLWKMVRFAWTAVVSFSALPLRVTTGGGLVVAGLGVLYALQSAYEARVLHITVPGWASVICFVTFFFGAMLVVIGLVGRYVARIFEEAKGRPLYIVSNLINLDETAALPERAIIVNQSASRAKVRMGRTP